MTGTQFFVAFLVFVSTGTVNGFVGQHHDSSRSLLHRHHYRQSLAAESKLNGWTGTVISMPRWKQKPRWKLNCRLYSTPSAKDSDNDSADKAGLSISRPKLQQVLLSQQYQKLQYAFASLGILLMLMPDRTLTTMLASKVGGAAGFGCAAGLSYILQGANDHDRLSSDTYQRLNVGLLAFCVLGLLAIPGESAFLPSAGSAMILSLWTTMLRGYGAFVAYAGWKRGVAGIKSDTDESEAVNKANACTFKPMLNELWSGTKETFRGLKVKDKKKSLTYRNCVLLVAVGIFSSFMEGLFNIRVSNEKVRFRRHS